MYVLNFCQVIPTILAFFEKSDESTIFQGGHRVTTNCEKVAIKLAKSAKQLDINHA